MEKKQRVLLGWSNPLQIDCKRAIPRDQQPESGKEGANYRTKKLFVGGLTQTTTEG